MAPQEFLFEVRERNAEDMKACPVFQELKGEQLPPVLRATFEKAGLLNDLSRDAKKKPKRQN